MLWLDYDLYVSIVTQTLNLFLLIRTLLFVFSSTLKSLCYYYNLTLHIIVFFGLENL